MTLSGALQTIQPYDRMVRKSLGHRVFDGVLTVGDWFKAECNLMLETWQGRIMFAWFSLVSLAYLLTFAALVIKAALPYWFPIGLAAGLTYGAYYHYTRVWLWPYREHLARMRRYDTWAAEREIIEHYLKHPEFYVPGMLGEAA